MSVLIKGCPVLAVKIDKHFESRGEFAVLAGVHETALSKIIKGVRKPNRDQIETFSKLLKCPAAELFQ
jgi:Helix-turn-helix